MIRLPQLLLFSAVFLLSVCASVAKAAMLPEDGSVYNQVHIMFECDEVPGADVYEITVVPACGGSFTIKNRQLTFLVTRGLQFGCRYSWSFRAFSGKKMLFRSRSNRFEINSSPRVMPEFFRAAVPASAKSGQGIVFLDYNAVAIDKKGHPVWFLPLQTDSLARLILRDLQLTPAGTITHLDVNGAYEKNLQGTVLWKAPDDGRVSGAGREEYHHELQKYNDGSYMVCGFVRLPQAAGMPADKAAQVRYNTVVHYNADGSIRWSWRETDALLQDTLFKKISHAGQAGHLNGFAFAPGGKQLFMSFKNLSEILLLDTATRQFVTGLSRLPLPVQFRLRQQHGPYVSAAGEIVVYNNNIDEKEEAAEPVHPSVLIFRCNPLTGSLKAVWQCRVLAAGYPGGIQGKEGYASLTKENTLLVCAGGANYAAEITRAKKVIWEAYFFSRQKNDTTWRPFSNYRCQAASSLYPLYYTLAYAGRVKGRPAFRLYNAGTEPGFFELTFAGDEKKYRSETLAPGRSQVFVPDVAAGTVFSCRVTPCHTAAGYRSFSWEQLPY